MVLHLDITQEDVRSLMEQRQLLLCMYYIHKERPSMVTPLISKVACISYRNIKFCGFSPINGCHLMLQPILLVITTSRVPMLCIGDGS